MITPPERITRLETQMEAVLTGLADIRSTQLEIRDKQLVTETRHHIERKLVVKVAGVVATAAASVVSIGGWFVQHGLVKLPLVVGLLLLTSANTGHAQPLSWHMVGKLCVEKQCRDIRQQLGGSGHCDVRAATLVVLYPGSELSCITEGDSDDVRA